MYRGLSVTPFNQFFVTSLLTNTRGHTAKIQKARCNLDVRRFFFSERVIDRWNRLQQEDIDVKTVNSFKTVLERKRQRKMGFFMDWWSAWPSGLMFWSSSAEQVRPHLVSYLVSYFMLFPVPVYLKYEIWNFMDNACACGSPVIGCSTHARACTYYLTCVTTIVYPGHLRSWSMRQFFRIGPRIDSHKGNRACK